MRNRSRIFIGFAFVMFLISTVSCTINENEMIFLDWIDQSAIAGTWSVDGTIESFKFEIYGDFTYFKGTGKTSGTYSWDPDIKAITLSRTLTVDSTSVSVITNVDMSNEEFIINTKTFKKR